MGLVPQEIFDGYNYFVDDFISTSFGVNCKLVYPPLKTNCANCIYDTMSNKSTNIYNGSGPQPFTFGVCPWCGGLGFTESVQTETIKLRLYYSPKHWIKIHPLINIPDNTIQAIGFLSDLPKIKQAQTMIANSDQEGFGNCIYDLLGNPVTTGFKHNRYLISMWTRAS